MRFLTLLINCQGKLLKINETHICKECLNENIRQVLLIIFFNRVLKRIKFVKHLKHSIFLVNIISEIFLAILINQQVISLKLNETSIKTLGAKIMQVLWVNVFLVNAQNQQFVKHLKHTIFLVNKMVKLFSVQLINWKLKQRKINKIPTKALCMQISSMLCG